MLARLTIQNYTIIEQLDISFSPELNIITGETGAGKSILIGALGLILGERADRKSLPSESRKCIIEGSFRIGAYELQDFFESNDLDYEEESTLRREITAEGKSRAFINDTPVSLQQLKELGERLVDIHSQHQNAQLHSSAFRLRMLDSFAGQDELLAEYAACYGNYRKLEHKLRELKERSLSDQAEAGYLQFQFDELEKAGLKEGEQELLEQELLRLNHAEEIKRNLSSAVFLLEESESPVTDQLREAGRQLSSLEKYSADIPALSQRLQSVLIELKDIAAELVRQNDRTQLDEQRRLEVEERLNLIYRLEQKHQRASVEELLALKEELQARLESIQNIDEELAELQAGLEKEEAALSSMALELSARREAAIPGLEEAVGGLLRETGMPEASFRIQLERQPEEGFRPTGIDKVSFLFSANKGYTLADVSKIASGGELSRLMFCIKGLAARHTALPTIVFDEIDTGISGEVALKVGKLMQQFSRHLQVITITHLPQIAGKGSAHYYVYKESKANTTFANIRKLNAEERVKEIAKMLSGNNPSPSALKNARELLEEPQR